MRQKRKTETEVLQPTKTSELSDETLQPRIPEAPISESDDKSASIHEHLFPTSSQLSADSSGRNLTDSIQVEVLGDMIIIRDSVPEAPRIYEAPVSESDDKDMGIDLFGISGIFFGKGASSELLYKILEEAHLDALRDASVLSNTRAILGTKSWRYDIDSEDFMRVLTSLAL
ncbi:hypothetical protein RhiirB3_395738 [Rhizophagus irregularis]|nr:hypothetical protein RhiirB3_395738 [Rhizophagus irregularis]